MYTFPTAYRKLVREISRLPSLGEKSASRLAYHLLYKDKDLARSLAKILEESAEHITLCDKCFSLSENSEQCKVCTDSSRNEHVLCVVEKPVDILAIERVGDYRGRYHVLHGLWSPMRGRAPESLKLAELLERVKSSEIKEIIVATSATVEGDATALYIASELHELGVSVSRLAQGMPKGGELEYADEVTLSRAMSGRIIL